LQRQVLPFSIKANMLSRYITREDYFLGEGLMIDGKIIDPTRGTGVMLRPKNDGKFSPLLMLPNLRGENNQVPRQRIIVSERECGMLVTVGRAELDISWTEQGYSTTDLVLLPAYQKKMWFRVLHDNLILELDRSTIQFSVAWECRIPRIATIRTGKETYLETSRSLLFHTASDNCIHSKIVVPDEGPIEYGKVQFSTVIELFEFVGTSSFIMGKYHDMHDRILEGRLTVLSQRMTELAEFRQESYTSGDYNTVIKRSMRTERTEIIESML